MLHNLLKLNNLSAFCYVLLLPFCSVSADYIWPIDGKILLNSNFAECRHNHFHAGIDLHMVEGTPLKAIDDGYVWHIAINPFGYGKSLFLKLNDGRTVVYAHLEKYNQKIEQIVENEQKRRFSYMISKYFKKRGLPVEKGDIIGYAGRTGAMGAHLHFEMRDRQNRPINPLSNGYSIVDSTPPLIKAIQIVPLDDSSSVCGIPFPIIVEPIYNGSYYTIYDTLGIQGRIGLEILSEDFHNFHSMRLNIEKVELYLNGKLTFCSKYERFSYAHTHEVELEFDYDLYQKGLGRFHRLFIYGDNHLSFYQKRDGVIDVTTIPNINEIKIVCYNAGNTRAVFIFYVKNLRDEHISEPNFPLTGYSPYFSGSGISFYRNMVRIAFLREGGEKIVSMKNLIPVHDELKREGNLSVGYFKIIPGKQKTGSVVIRNSFEENIYSFRYSTIEENESGTINSSDDNFKVHIEKGDLYENLYARIHKVKENIPEGLKLLKGPYIVRPPGMVFREGVNIIFPYHGPHSSKIAIYKKQKEGWLFLKSRYDIEKKAYTARSRHLGRFALLEDSKPPVISDFKTEKEDGFIKKVIFIVKDTGSGFRISDINIKLDGISYIPAFDAYRDEVSYLLFGEKLTEGSHTAEIKIKDRAGNKNSLSVSF
jgi:hypothetical protein